MTDQSQPTEPLTPPPVSEGAGPEVPESKAADDRPLYARPSSWAIAGIGFVAALLIGGVGLAVGAAGDGDDDHGRGSFGHMDGDEDGGPGAGPGPGMGMMPGGGQALGDRDGGMMGEPGGPGMMDGPGGSLHEQSVFEDASGDYVTRVRQAGDVTSVSGSSLTVASADGFEVTYQVEDDSVVRSADGDGIDAIAKGDTVVVTGQGTGDLTSGDPTTLLSVLEPSS